jgi:hypothetical protein
VIIQVGDEELEVRSPQAMRPAMWCLCIRRAPGLCRRHALSRGIGRFDLPGGWATLLHSIRRQLLTLPDDYVIYWVTGCDHDRGSASTTRMSARTPAR